MPTYIILITIGLIGLIIASLIDIKKREVPDWLSFSLIVSGLGIRLIYSLTTLKFSFFLYGLLGTISLFIVGSLMYYTRQWGGGDAKLLAALGAIFATGPLDTKIPYFITLFINILIIGAIYGLSYSIYLIATNYKDFSKRIKKVIKRDRIIRLIIITLTIVLVSLATNNQTIKFLLLTLAFSIIIIPFIWASINTVEKISMFKLIPVSKLTEGDWIANKNIRRKFKISELGIEQNQIKKLKKLKIKKILIKEGIAFVPSFLIATILTLLFGNLIYFFI